MKKKISAILFALSLCLCSALPAFADELPVVIDNADLLSDSEEASLDSAIKNIQSKFDFDIVILTEDSIGSSTATAYADDYYDYNGYRNDGLLFLLSMENRDWAISTKGFGITAFTDYGQEYIMDRILDYFSDGDYATGFEELISYSDDFIQAAKDGKPYDVDNEKKTFMDYFIGIGIVLIIAVLAATITVNVLKSSMKTAKPQHEAQNYVRNGSFNVTGSRDMFLYSTVSKTPRAESNSGGGGSSTHTSSSGSSHGGSSGHF